jgi:hypothetical protein
VQKKQPVLLRSIAENRNALQKVIVINIGFLLANVMTPDTNI